MGTQVLIAGGGPTGLTLGIELARRGVGVRIVDKATEFFAGSRGDGLQPRTLEVFDDLGVLDAVLAASGSGFAIKVYVNGEYRGERRMVEPVDPTPDLPHPNPRVLGQSQTEGLLRDRLAEFGVHVELGTELTGFTQDDTGVTATLNGDETVRVDYLVGADGGRSVVRKTLGIPFEGTTDESIRMLLGDVRADDLDHDYGYWLAGKDNLTSGIALTPLPGGELFQFGCPLEESDSDTSLETLQKQVDRFSGGFEVRLHDLAWSTVWRPNVRLARRFREGRVFLAGDAAHVHPPTGGQGLNTGVQDGYNLGWKLAAVLGGADPELLDSYEAERLPVAARVLGVSSELLRKHTEGEEDAYRRGPETHQLDISYRNGPLARDDRAEPGRVRAGDRAPDAPVVTANGKRTTLFDLFRGPHATLLLFGDAKFDADPGVPVHRVLRSREHAEGQDVVDADGHAFAGYDVTDGTAVLVRPDGYIARIS